MTPDFHANRSPSGLLEQSNLPADAGNFNTILTANGYTHVNRIHIYNASVDSAGSIKIAHTPSGGSPSANQTIFTLSPAFGSVWIWEAPSLGSTVSLAPGDTLGIDTDVPVGYSIYGHGSER